MAETWLPRLPHATTPHLAALLWLYPKPHLVSSPSRRAMGCTEHHCPAEANHWHPLGISCLAHNQSQKYTTFLWCSSPRTWQEDAWGWVGKDNITKWVCCPPATHGVTWWLAHVLTDLYHDDLQLHCRHKKCHREAMQGLAALLTSLAPDSAGTGSSDSMHQWCEV